jgi:ATP-dependent Lon protease
MNNRKKTKTNDGDLSKLIIERIDYIQEIIQNTTISMQNYKNISIFSNVDLNACITVLNELYVSSRTVISTLDVEPIENTINSLQKIIDKLSIIMSGYGTKNIEDLIYITLGSDFPSLINPHINAKFELIKRFVHPVGFKLIPDTTCKISDNSLCIDKITDESIKLESASLLECFECDVTTSSLNYNINGIRVILRGNNNKLIIVNGIVDDINLELLSNSYIDLRKQQLLDHKLSSKQINDAVFVKQVENLTLHDILIFGNQDMIKKHFSTLLTVSSVKNDNIEQTIKKFVKFDVLSRRNMLIDLLTYNMDSEIQYIAYMLYDLITVDSNEVSIFDSFPWKIKLLFKDTMRSTIKYVQSLTTKYDVSRITLEQQIYLLRVPDYVKEKAMNKLKEIKHKSDESGSKAKQYLEGLIKIPFNIYREEPILKITKRLNQTFRENLALIKRAHPILNIVEKDTYTNLEIYQILEQILAKDRDFNPDKISTNQIEIIIKYINQNNSKKIPWSKYKNKASKLSAIQTYKTTCEIKHRIQIDAMLRNDDSKLYEKTQQMLDEIHLLKNSMSEIERALDDSVYGHKTAKNQIVKIISQWISGENSGHCFGFEGSPGVGKTSLAKIGLSNCLKDEQGKSRPFAFIAVGGSCNGSTLEGHGYTYVNSSWGKIADVLMEHSCLNLIIYFDELDKESKNGEHGKEITGILTHLLDQSQNSEFEDKFFAGIKLDLSKALIIVSYNDPNNIDKVLLDRIHRIKFDNLTADDKMVIAKDYMLPEINRKMGFDNTIIISDEILYEIINNYTSEPGVRKLKEILFDLYGELNIELLKCSDLSRSIPIILTMDEVEMKYLAKYKKIKDTKIHAIDYVGTINGLWANALGKGGIIPIETVFYPSEVFLDLKLTGMQGDVMKESMNVAKSLAWSLCSPEIQAGLITSRTKNGIHIHCPEGAVSKDGPSAGTAITTAIYSLLNDMPIRKNVAITGEIDLRGNITAIGGLEHKITGGIRAGVTKFLYPKENAKDFCEIQKKTKIASDIEFVEVSHISEVFKHVFI